MGREVTYLRKKCSSFFKSVQGGRLLLRSDIYRRISDRHLVPDRRKRRPPGAPGAVRLASTCVKRACFVASKQRTTETAVSSASASWGCTNDTKLHVGAP